MSSAQFYCTACRIGFKDNLALINHNQSPAHLQKTGQPLKVKPSTLADVRDRIETLAKERGLK